MSCTATDNNFFNVNSFTYISEICEGGWYLVLSIVVNVVLALFVIYFGEQRFRYQRLVQFIEVKYTEKNKIRGEWLCTFNVYQRWLTLHQLVLVVNFIFLVYTNILQLLLSALFNVVFRCLFYYYDWIPNDGPMYNRVRDRDRNDLFSPVAGTF